MDKPPPPETLEELLERLDDQQKIGLFATISSVLMNRLDDTHHWARTMIMALFLCGTLATIMVCMAPELSGPLAVVVFFTLGIMALVTKPRQPVKNRDLLYSD